VDSGIFQSRPTAFATELPRPTEAISRTSTPRIPFDASPEVRRALETIGRTEDLAFSPDGTRLALAGACAARILILEIRIESVADRCRVVVRDGFALNPPSLRFPHGVAFLDADSLIVADRDGYVRVFAIPRSQRDRSDLAPAPRRTIRGGWRHRLRWPGSVAATETQPGVFDLLVCNNFANVVTSHRLDTTRRMRVENNGVLLQRGLEIPDGVSISADRRWVAVSNHASGNVFIYARTPSLGRASDPDAVLTGIVCPHGLRFAAHGRQLFVADAAAPFVHVFEEPAGGWRGEQRPAGSLRVLDDTTFARGRCSAEEGGPKGIDLDREVRVLATTCEHQVLAFFDLRSALARAVVDAPGPSGTTPSR